MAKKTSKNPGLLAGLLGGITGGGIEVVDLTMTLDQKIPTIVLPPELGQSWPFRMEEISRYDHRGPATYWNNFSCGEHTGTHFDAPVHWISGKDLPDNATDTIPAEMFLAHACVVDCSAEAAVDPDYLLTIERVEAWESRRRVATARSPTSSRMPRSKSSQRSPGSRRASRCARASEGTMLVCGAPSRTVMETVLRTSAALARWRRKRLRNSGSRSSALPSSR